MSAPKQEPKKINCSNDDVLALLADGIRKKYPELADEEFEVTLTYDGYNYLFKAIVEHY
jgi:hypothetical protein